MSNTLSNKKVNVSYRKYLRLKNEPKEETVHAEAKAEVDPGLVVSTYPEKKKLRRVAKRLRYLLSPKRMRYEKN